MTRSRAQLALPPSILPPGQRRPFVGRILTPMIMGRRLELNPVEVFLAIAFCAWMWGPLGVFLAVPPLLMALLVSLGHAFGEEKPELPH